MKNCNIFLLLLLMGSVTFSFAQTTQTSDFSVNNETWTIFNTSSGASSAATYNSTGGNPGGYISDGGTFSGPTLLYAEAPAKFKGNFSFSYNKTLTFDLKQSFAGANDNTNGDVIITSSTGVTVVYQLPTKPVPAGFTSYSITLNETFTGWHYNSVAGAAPTQVQMKQALSNITSLRIRTKYTLSNTSTVTGSLDNVVLNGVVFLPPPVITSFTPAAAVANTNITINGSGFNPTPAQNVVSFNGIKASIVNASATQLVVKSPAGAGYGLITAVNLTTGLQGTSVQSFSPLFNNNKNYGGRIIQATMLKGSATVLQTGTEVNNNFGNMGQGDFDGDGWMDLITTETTSRSIVAYRNLGTGTLSTAGFSTAITLPSFAAIPGGITGLSQLVVADVDSDGLPDVTASVSSNLNLGTSFIAVYRNTSTVGNISFAAPAFFSLPYYSSLTLASGDIDGDGRIDFMTTGGTSPGNLWINQNQSTPGNIDFAFGVVSGPATSGYNDIVVGDLNNDGKPEIIAAGYNAATFSIYRNTSTPGTISVVTPFTIPASVNRAFAAIADLDADGRLDLVWGTNTGSVFFSKNNFSGTLDATSFGAFFSIASPKLSTHEDFTIADINADGLPDVVIAGLRDLGILQNVGTPGNLSAASFNAPVIFQGSPTAYPIAFAGVMISDLDGDNKPEVSVTYTSAPAAVTERGIFIFHNESAAVPGITGISPATANTGATVTMTGDRMFTESTPPIVRLSNIIVPISGTATNLSTAITASTGTISSNISVINHGLIGITPYFNETFTTGKIINSSSFGPTVDFGLSTGTRNGIEAADFDDDGKSDFYVVDNTSTGKIFRNTAVAGAITTTSLTQVTTTYNGNAAIAAFDIDGDGKIDMNSGSGLLKNSSTSGNISFLSGPNGVSTIASSYLDAGVADFNKDGKLDMALTISGSTILVYENHSTRGPFSNTGNFETFGNTFTVLPKNGTNGDIVAEDFDGDGYPDIIVTNESTNNMTFYLNAKVDGPITAASFGPQVNFSSGTGNLPNGITAKDFDGDGKIDFAVTWSNLTFVSVYLNTSTVGNMSFSSPLTVNCVNKGFDIGSQDLDGDGKAEIVIIHQTTPGSFSVFQNQSTPGNLNFGTAVNYPLTRTPVGLNFADINADGKPDIGILGTAGSPAPVNALMIFENKIASVILTITQQPGAATACIGSTATFTTAASGTTNITYQWQYSTTLTGTYSDIANGGGYSNVGTATLSVNTASNFGAGFYRCKINGDFVATQFTNAAQLTIINLPAPGVTPAAGCQNSAVTITATGGINGQYRWYTSATGPTPIAGEVNSTYTTLPLTLVQTYTYYVAVNNGICESVRTPLNVVVSTCGPGSQPPVIGSLVLSVIVNGILDVDLTSAISDPDNNADLSTLSVTVQTLSGVTATITPAHHLVINYSGSGFLGADRLTIKVCDLSAACITKELIVDVNGDIIIYNAVSPNGDGKNDFFLIQYIESLPDTQKNKVSIFNRWGDEVFTVEDYNNSDRVFRGLNKSGAELPNGTYYYKIDFGSGRKEEDGFLVVRR